MSDETDKFKIVIFERWRSWRMSLPLALKATILTARFIMFVVWPCRTVYD